VHACSARVHRGALYVFSAVAISTVSEVLSVHAGIAQNIMWAPTTATRTLALFAALTPWAGGGSCGWLHWRARCTITGTVEHHGQD